MSVLFIADIHLSVKKPNITDNFLNFLHNKAIYADELYILGDLFECWIGDDDPNPMYKKIAQEIKKLKKKLVPCYFIHGNRDFLLGQRYANLCGMTLLQEPYILEVSGNRIIISHGDRFCVNDKNYQYFKYIIRKLWLKKLFLTLPLSIRTYIVNLIRNKSSQSNNKKSKKNICINIQSMLHLLSQYKANILIHGHTHKAAIHTLINNNLGIFYRVNLGAWYKYGSIIEINKFGLSLIKFN
ncbi:UDP-2,3-diacylglucosamine diphosphatase [Blochmannia endosymbiont of Camponotus (Colobopsis) obliquus]|uniref:UDP-2,3-diacylglucosamine diphosphatase n=1 Tax=Blochmannia endosymbiont of Camponotus (Colobopsis) obliquus TaxID=1505597 RepID=UPI00061A7119|nr:UDP-2,3-diacylglucosamine diphosphatase [Blochmannia endosymbiont of Camponotus (Colobopsis) obliquus]AKC60470.1 UDP-2,3-diacylglucosamine hydrolase [Blochmannia endosymbiont of Camponotus (Colobopsis) obliquus]